MLITYFGIVLFELIEWLEFINNKAPEKGHKGPVRGNPDSRWQVPSWPILLKDAFI